MTGLILGGLALIVNEEEVFRLLSGMGTTGFERIIREVLRWYSSLSTCDDRPPHTAQPVLPDQSHDQQEDARAGNTEQNELEHPRG